MRSRYPDQALFVARACRSLGLSFTDLDDGNGYLFAVSDGTRSLVSGAGWICTYPLNTASAYEVSRDKRHASSVLRNAGIPTIPGELFFVSDYHANLRAPGREIADALRYVAALDGEVFCKPNAGSRGDFAEIVSGADAFAAYVERVKARYDAILVQSVLDGDEYRVFCIDDEAIFCAKKAAFSLCGDGSTGLGQLVRNRSAGHRGSGVSPLDDASVLAFLQKEMGLAADDVLEPQRRVSLPGRRNLSAGGEVLDFTTSIDPRLSQLAIQAIQAIGLRVGGVDIFDVSPHRDLTDLVVIEVNGNPSISSLSRLGRDDIVDRIWETTLTRYFRERAILEGDRSAS